MDFIDRLLPPRGAARGSASCTVVCAAIMFLLAWQVWIKAGKIAGYGDTTDVLRITVGPFVYFMAAMVALTGAGAPRQGVLPARRRPRGPTSRARHDRSPVGLARHDGAGVPAHADRRSPWASSASSATPTCATGTSRAASPMVADQGLRDRAQLHAVGGAAVHPDGQLRRRAPACRRSCSAPPTPSSATCAAAWPWRPSSACAGFGAICGSSIATAATMAKVAYPSMKKFGYSDRLADRRHRRAAARSAS